MPLVPANDQFANATSIENGASGWEYGSNIATTSETGEPLNHGKTVWFKWTCPTSGNYFFTTNGSIGGGIQNGRPVTAYWTTFPSVLQVFTANNPSSPSVSALSEVSYLQDQHAGVGAGFEYGAQVAFAATAATVYYIRVDSRDGLLTGDILLRWDSWYSTTIGSCIDCFPSPGQPCSVGGLTAPKFNAPAAWKDGVKVIVGTTNLYAFSSVIAQAQFPPGEYGAAFCGGGLGSNPGGHIPANIVWQMLPRVGAFLHSGAAEKFVGPFWDGLLTRGPSNYLNTTIHYNAGDIVISLYDNAFYQCTADVSYPGDGTIQTPANDPTHWTSAINGGAFFIAGGNTRNTYATLPDVKTNNQCVKASFCHTGGNIAFVVASDSGPGVGPPGTDNGDNGWVDGDTQINWKLFKINSNDTVAASLTSFTVNGFANGHDATGGFNVTAVVTFQNTLENFTAGTFSAELLAQKGVSNPKVYNGSTYVTGPLNFSALAPFATASATFTFVAPENQSCKMVVQLVDLCANSSSTQSFDFELQASIAFDLVALDSSYQCSGVSTPFVAFMIENVTNVGNITTSNLKYDVALISTTGLVPLIGLCTTPRVNPSATALTLTLPDVGANSSLNPTNNPHVLVQKLDGKTTVVYQVTMHDDLNHWPPQKISLLV